jgi:hypothetical protein
MVSQSDTARYCALALVLHRSTVAMQLALVLCDWRRVRECFYSTLRTNRAYISCWLNRF